MVGEVNFNRGEMSSEACAIREISMPSPFESQKPEVNYLFVNQNETSIELLSFLTEQPSERAVRTQTCTERESQGD